MRDREISLSCAWLIACICVRGNGYRRACVGRSVTRQDRSRYRRGVASGDIISFKGIPYAAPPVGNLRWRAPQPVRHWDGVLEAAFGHSCMQTDDLPKSEDCLTLNMWRPAAVSATPLPVMVWIYGGALAHGNTPQYPADALAAQGVIVVSMNYRMGRLGFFAHPGAGEGNFGGPDRKLWLHGPACRARMGPALYRRLWR